MSTQKVTYQGEVYCKIADTNVNLLLGHYIDFNDNKTPFTKVLCPYLIKGFWGNNKCEKGGKCGIAEGAGS